MKNIIFTSNIKKNPILEEELFLRLRKMSIKDVIKINSIDIKVDDSFECKEFLKDFESMTYLVVFFVYNILLNNRAAIQKKKPPYDLEMSYKLDFNEKKFQFHIFVDDVIFGLVVGTKFKNITSLIQTFYPILAKTSFSNEIRFFPLSRKVFNTERV